jgi:hypothetical protein
MSDGELAFLAMVIGCFVVFAIAAIWLRADYVKFRGRRPAADERSQVQLAE